LGWLFFPSTPAVLLRRFSAGEFFEVSMTDREIDVLEKASNLIVASHSEQHSEEAEALRIAVQALVLEHEYKNKFPEKKPMDWNKIALWGISLLALVVSVIAKLIGLDVKGFLP
jgi:hypothetical protein